MKPTNQTSLSFTLPEELLRVRSDAEPGFPTDAITAACERASAVAVLLSDQFDGAKDGRVSDAVILNALWDIQGTLEQIKVLAQYAHDSQARAGTAGGDA